MIKLKKWNFKMTLLAVLALFFSPFCAEKAMGAEKPLIVCTLFPQYDFARQITGDRAKVVMLLPPGVDSHTFDPKPRDIQMLNKADLFVFTGASMEPWAQRIVDSLVNKKLVVVDASSGVRLMETHLEHDEHNRGHQCGPDCDHDHGHHHHHGLDPHIWLNLNLAMKMVDNIVDGLRKVDPKNLDFYRKNAAAYKAKLKQLDMEFKDAVSKGKKDTLVFGGHFAYIYFLKHYGLHYVTAYNTCSAEGEPSVRQLTSVIRYMERNGVRYIFHEELADPKVARSIAEQTGAQLLLFNTGHNVTKEELRSGITFLDIMRGNLTNVEKALR